MQQDSSNSPKITQLIEDTQEQQDEKYFDNKHQELKTDDGKMKPIIKGANDLSLGISMVVAVLLGLGLGYGLYKLTGYYWLLWVGLGYGVAAAILNVVRACKRLTKDLNELKNDEKYKYMLDKIIEKQEEKTKK
ncbi:hypothetical protein CQA53_01985 [Helicobacter didelphidarum]|uniref:Arginine biosynthesis protein ArgJ n=1 Tax=Helicobacter didelphidarum TaxID=2040648 RepID=A0A3D8IPM2_9HELI|nr:hypothetical protein CQA53_01985 [Helicobacter didelphidarum]